jgi:hypothetical protein
VARRWVKSRSQDSIRRNRPRDLLTSLKYKIIVPLPGIDPRKIYVFATARSLLIEIRFKGIIHDLTRVTESIDRRISREQETSWSELIDFDTLVSFDLA